MPSFDTRMGVSRSPSAWWVFCVLVGLILLAQLAQLGLLLASRKPDTPDPTRLVALDWEAKASYALKSLPTPESPQATIQPVYNQLKRLLGTDLEAAARRRMAVLEYEYRFGNPAETVRALFKVKSALSEADRKRNAEAWNRLYGDSRLSVDEIPALVKEIQRTYMGWYAQLAEAHAYQRAGDSNRAAQLRTRLERQIFTALLLSMGLVLMAGGFFLLGGVVWFLYLYKPRKPLPTRPLEDYPPHALDGAVWGVNLFLIMLALFGLLFPWLQTLSLHLGGLLTIILVLYYLSRWQAQPESPRGWLAIRSANLWHDLRDGLLAFAAYLVLVVPLLWLISVLMRFLPFQPPPLFGESLVMTHWWEKMILFLRAALLAPFLEEIVFRGALFSALWQRTGRFRLSAFLSGLIFAALHPQFLIGLLPITVLGILLARLYAERGSLLPCMIVHALNNGAITLLVLLWS